MIDETKCAALVEVMNYPPERQRIAEGLLQTIKERDQWRDCADRLVASSGWHDQWPKAVAHYRKLKEELE
jgi:hypothetical protein